MLKENGEKLLTGKKEANNRWKEYMKELYEELIDRQRIKWQRKEQT